VTGAVGGGGAQLISGGAIASVMHVVKKGSAAGLNNLINLNRIMVSLRTVSNLYRILVGP
jgi:hypothetical protein